MAFDARRFGLVCGVANHLPVVKLSAHPLAAHQARRVTGAEAIIDVHHHDIRSTAVEHAEERRQPAERAAVSDAGRDCYDRDTDHAADHARQCALHPRYYYYHPRLHELAPDTQETVDTGHTHVEGGPHLVAHQPRGQRSFLSHRDVRCARAHDMDDP